MSIQVKSKVPFEKSLQYKNPELSKQWHPIKNKKLTPNDVRINSGKKVWWKCEKGHEWQATIAKRTRGDGCPYCSGHRACKDNCLATINPKLAKEWHLEKNGKLTPKDVTPRSDKKVWWKCKKGHEWQAIIGNRTTGQGCPYCSGRRVCKDNCLATIKPELAKEWHPKKNGKLTPKDVTCGCGKKVWWICKKKHEWKATIDKRSRGTGCPYCAGLAVCEDNCLATVNPELAKEWHPDKNGTLTAKDVVPGSNKRVWWKCFYGHEWIAKINSRKQGSNCPTCYTILRKEKFYNHSSTSPVRIRSRK